MVGSTDDVTASVEHVDAMSAPDVQATFCATLVDEWIRRGVRHAVIAPGSRSTPMAIAIADRSELAVHVVHDERSAAFIALGLGLGGTPSLLLCTSGTAAANFFPAVVEAGLSEVPMIVLTADRPEELRGVGAPQTIDQIELFGGHVRWFHDPGVPEIDGAARWRSVATDAHRFASTGPVQLNLPFREPLLGRAGSLPEPIDLDDDATTPPDDARRRDPVPPSVRAARGVILAGGRSGVDPGSIAALHRSTGWPIVADPVSQLRHLDGVVTTADALLRHGPFADAHLPDVIVRIGRPAASKVLAQWSKRATDAGAVLIQVGGPGVIDPDHDVAAVCAIDEVLEAVDGAVIDDVWTRSWNDAESAADAAIGGTVAAAEELTEPAVARLVAEALPADAELVVASSMPVRDLEWYGGRTARAHANRGANGIDGVTSTALGIALDGPTSYVLIGDLAFVHDSSALVALTDRNADLRIVVVDNDGGGIFSFLPQARALDHDRYEQLFGTPLAVDVVALAAAHGVPAVEVTTPTALRAQLTTPGPWVCRVPSDRAHNVVVHDEIHQAVAAALRGERSR